VTEEDKSADPIPQFALVASALLTCACGGGGEGSPSTSAPISTSPPSPASPVLNDTARFMAQASLGFTRAELEEAQTMGPAAWIERQFALPSGTSHFEWLSTRGYGASTNINSLAGIDNSLWHRLITAKDPLRTRVALALSEILVIGVQGLTGPWRQFSAANYMDILERNAFGNYRTLLEEVSLSPAMGSYLTFRGNAKANPRTGSVPDENYARELMQLFTIGLVDLQPGGELQETYSLEDVTGLARVFTGFDFDTAGFSVPYPPEVVRRPMAQVASRYETGEKRFLGVVIPANTPALESLKIALDTVFRHPNTAPFVSRQLIQRMVTSNPSPGYIQRVSVKFENNGAGVRGDLKAVIKAILLDPEARSPEQALAPTYGKFREPMVRFLNWARAFSATSASGNFAIGDLSDPSTRLGQSPLRAPSVFNFFRPGFSTVNLADQGLVAPELQITTETSTAGYLNYMQRAINGQGVGDLTADYASLINTAKTPKTLVDDLALLFTANSLAPETRSGLVTALEAMPQGSEAQLKSRVMAAILITFASPEFIIQR
jgi:uncharacterized protein (DUF1800 family)